jgi:hypothetical protein
VLENRARSIPKGDEAQYEIDTVLIFYRCVAAGGHVLVEDAIQRCKGGDHAERQVKHRVVINERGVDASKLGATRHSPAS